jgi:hypothetical protein
MNRKILIFPAILFASILLGHLIASASPAKPTPVGHSWTEIECDNNMCVDVANHRVGIGTTSPAIKLAIGDTDSGLDLLSGNLAIYINNVERMRIDSAGSVGIGKVPSWKLDVNGTVNAEGLRSTGDLNVGGNIKMTGADFLLDNSGRRGGAGGAYRRALVHEVGDVLTINYNGDYTGGTRIDGNLNVGGNLNVNDIWSRTNYLTLMPASSSYYVQVGYGGTPRDLYVWGNLNVGGVIKGSLGNRVTVVIRSGGTTDFTVECPSGFAMTGLSVKANPTYTSAGSIWNSGGGLTVMCTDITGGLDTGFSSWTSESGDSGLQTKSCDSGYVATGIKINVASANGDFRKFSLKCTKIKISSEKLSMSDYRTTVPSGRIGHFCIPGTFMHSLTANYASGSWAGCIQDSDSNTLGCTSIYL